MWQAVHRTAQRVRVRLALLALGHWSVHAALPLQGGGFSLESRWLPVARAQVPRPTLLAQGVPRTPGPWPRAFGQPTIGPSVPHLLRFWYEILYTRHLLRLPESEPDRLLDRALEGMPPGKALVVNLGQGLVAFALAQRGWDVEGFDVSDIAVAQARSMAQRLGLPLQATQSTFSKFHWTPDCWDLVVMLYAYVPVHSREAGDRLVRSLRPGGRLVFENYEPRWQDRSHVLPGTLAEKDLLEIFAGLEVLWLERKLVGSPVDRGTTIIQFVGQKPY